MPSISVSTGLVRLVGWLVCSLDIGPPLFDMAMHRRRGAAMGIIANYGVFLADAAGLLIPGLGHFPAGVGDVLAHIRADDRADHIRGLFHA